MTQKSHDRIDEYRKLLASCSGRKCEGVFRQVADRYEDDLLELEEFDEQYFQLILDLLSEEALYSKPGVWNFLLVLGTEQGKLQPRHYEALAKCIVQNYRNYLDEDLCLAVCDFVARNYSTNGASKILDQLAAIEATKTDELQGFVSDGRRIVEAEEKRRSTPH